MLDIAKILQSLSGSLLAGELFETSSAYEQSTQMGVGLLLTQIGAQFEQVASVLVGENQALVSLFQGSAPAVADPELRARLEAAATSVDLSRPECLRVSALRRANEGLRSLLIELHEHVEAHPSGESRRIEREIWEELARSVTRRAFLS